MNENPTNDELVKFATRVVEAHYIAGWVCVLLGGFHWKLLAVGLGLWGLAGMFSITAVLADSCKGDSE